jgi:hypothetical protein
MDRWGVGILRRITTVFLGFCALQGISLSQSAAQPDCQNTVFPVADDPLGYKARSNVCEGLFVQPVAANSRIRVVGLHEHRPVFKPGTGNNGNPLSVSVEPAEAQKFIVLRAVSARYRQYYRMDAVFKLGEIPFLWNRNVISSPEIALKPDELMVIACRDSCNSQPLHLLPVSVTADGMAASKSFEIALTSNVDIAEIRIHAVRLSDGRTVEDDEVLRGRQLLAGIVQRVPLNKLQQSGDYHVVITATPLYTGAEATTQVDIRIP